MTIEFEHTILLVDDEPAILNSLQRLLRKEKINILTASSGTEGLEVLFRYKKPVSLIISDQRMPGITGAEFLERSKAIFPDAVRFLLTGYSDMNAVIDAVNKGEIHRYLSKPWNDEELVLHFKQAIEQYDLKAENKRLFALTQKQNKQLFEFGKMMEQKVKERSDEIINKNKELVFLNRELEFNLFNTVRAFAALTEMNMPFLEGHGKRVGGHARGIAKKLSLLDKEITHIEIAAILHDIGKIGLPKKLWENQDRSRWTKEEETLYQKHPEEGQKVVAFINRLDEVGVLIRHHHERFDGQGYPDGLASQDIPLGSKIISIADSYDKIVLLKIDMDRIVKDFLSEKNISRDQLPREELIRQSAIHHLTRDAGTKFDPDVMTAFLETLKEDGVKSVSEKPLHIYQLKEGMTLSRALYTTKGRFLLTYQTTLTENTIKRLKIMCEAGEIPDEIFISQE